MATKNSIQTRARIGLTNKARAWHDSKNYPNAKSLFYPIPKEPYSKMDILSMTKTLLKSCGKNTTRHGWQVEFFDSVNTRGKVNHSKATIYYSLKHIGVATNEEWLNTITNEVAHALCVAGAGHGEEWKYVMNLLGVEKPERLYTPTIAVDAMVKQNAKWVSICPTCGSKDYYQRKPRSEHICIETKDCKENYKIYLRDPSTDNLNKFKERVESLN